MRNFRLWQLYLMFLPCLSYEQCGNLGKYETSQVSWAQFKFGYFSWRMRMIQPLVSQNLTIVNDFKLPKFKNLIRLEIEANGDPGWNFLMRFLECSPNLEYLILQKGQKRFDFDEYWRPPQQVPICLSFVLKEIEIIEFTGKQYELEAIEYLLINATVLNKMTINCQFSKMQTFMKLAALPKGSQKCLVDLQF